MFFQHLSRSQKIFTAVAFTALLLGLLNALAGWGLCGISSAGFSVLMLFLASLLLWLFVSIDWPSLLCLLGLGLLPEIGFKTAFQQSFGNSTFVFLTFTFALTYCLQTTPALKRLTAKALNAPWARRNAWRFVLSYLSVLLLMASFMSPTILFMIAFPIYEAIAQQFGWQKGDKSASLLLFSTYTTIALGTAMTPINHVFAITALGIYEEAFQQSISYGQYLLLAVPLGLLLFGILLVSLRFIWRLDLSGISAREVNILDDLPPVQPRERWIVGIFSLVVALWILPELLSPLWPGLAAFFKRAGNAFPPLLGLILLALLAVDGKALIQLPQALKEGVYWPSLLLVGAALALGSALTNPEIGLVDWVKASAGPQLTSLAPQILILVFVAWTGLQTNLSSNLVTVSVVGSMAVTIFAGQSTAVQAAILLPLIGFMASLALMTPPAMPYVGISIGSKWLSSKQAFRYGLWVLVWAVLLATFLIYPLGVRIL